MCHESTYGSFVFNYKVHRTSGTNSNCPHVHNNTAGLTSALSFYMFVIFSIQILPQSGFNMRLAHRSALNTAAINATYVYCTM